MPVMGHSAKFNISRLIGFWVGAAKIYIRASRPSGGGMHQTDTVYANKCNTLVI